MKVLKYTAATFLILFAAAYFALWGYSAVWFRDEIDRLYANAEKDGIEYLGPKPVLSNFPFVPEAYYTGGIKTGNLEILFPEMVLRGYPIPYLTLTATFPNGVSLGGPVDPSVWSLHTLTVKGVIPPSFPETMTFEDLVAWRDAGGKVTVRSFSLTKGDLAAEGHGFLALDDQVQPVFLLDAILKGHENFIAGLRDGGLIPPFPAAIATTILNGLGKQDEKTGERVVPIQISVRNRMLTLGPVQLLLLPMIDWDRRTPPDRPL